MRNWVEPCGEGASINPLLQRSGGVLLHPTSLPSGRLDDDVLRWLDIMHRARLSVWQMLPLGIPDDSGSPYQSCSAFASNPDLLAPESKLDNGDGFDAWRAEQSDWLEDFALFQVLRRRYRGKAWWQWPREYARRNPRALGEVRHNARAPIRGIMEQQYLLDLRWRTVRREAADRGIALFGDMPIFVAHESADVWARPCDYLLDGNFQPEFVAGVPPDYFSDVGQRWGNPHYDWERMEASGFGWWMERLQRQFSWFDLVRLDHFRALAAVWMIESACETATDGFWRETPGRALLAKLRATMGDLPIVAEDLGIITDEVRRLRKDFALPGMAVLQFAFDGSMENPHRPENITFDTVAYTGTHDNNTTVGWFESLDERARAFVVEVLGRPIEPDIATVMIEEAFGSDACLAIAPLQDFLGLDACARMNTPGLTEHNWKWKFHWEQMNDSVIARIRGWVEDSGRVPDA